MSASAVTYLFVRLCECQSFASANNHLRYLAFVASATPALFVASATLSLPCTNTEEMPVNETIHNNKDAVTFEDTETSQFTKQIYNENDYNQYHQQPSTIASARL